MLLFAPERETKKSHSLFLSLLLSSRSAGGTGRAIGIHLVGAVIMGSVPSSTLGIGVILAGPIVIARRVQRVRSVVHSIAWDDDKCWDLISIKYNRV